MKFINKIEELDTIIIEYGRRMLVKHINNGENDLIPLETYENTIFNNIQISDYARQYKVFNNVAVWLIDNLTDVVYTEAINSYLQSNITTHGQKVYKSYLDNTDYFQDVYFGKERKEIVNKQGLLFVLTEKTEENVIVKVCYFKPVKF